MKKNKGGNIPAKNRVKQYRAQAYYHVFNRGAKQVEVFFERKDYQYFGALLRREVRRRSIYIRAYCLLPNHFHLLLFQQQEREITEFMRSIGISYAMFLRKKYNHSGQVFQGVYKAARKRNEREIRECEEYILANPRMAGYENWPYVGKNIFRFGSGL